jgi:WD40 repeat protein/tetratricopeptide (TPR) repeat protein
MVHRAPVNSVAFSPDGKMILTDSDDQRARLWNASTGRPIGEPIEHQDSAMPLAFSADGKVILTRRSLSIRIASGGTPPPRLWDAATGRPISPASGSMPLRLWDADARRPIIPRLNRDGTIESSGVKFVAFSPDSKTFLTWRWRDNKVYFGNAATGLPIGEPLDYQIGVGDVTFSPDGKTFLVWCYLDNKVHLGNAVTGLPIGKPLQHQDGITIAVFSPDGKTILTGSADRTAQQWDTATGLPICPPMVHRDAVESVAFGPGGSAILTGTRGTARLWVRASGMPTGQPLEYLDAAGSVKVVSPDGQIILTIGTGINTSMRLWNAATCLPVGPEIVNNGYVTRETLSPNSKIVFSVDDRGTAQLWDTATARSVGQTKLPGNTTAGQLFGVPLKMLQHQAGAHAVAFSPDGKFMITGSADKSARLWDIYKCRNIITYFKHERAVWSVAFSPNGKIIATGCSDGVARLWDATKGEPIGQPMLHQECVTFVTFGPDGRTIMTGTEGGVQLWDTATCQPVGQPIMHERNVASVAPIPYTTTILVGTGDGNARVWDVGTGQPIGPPLKHEGPISSLAISPDGTTIATASTPYSYPGGGHRPQSTARLWHLPPIVDDDLSRIKLWVETMTGLAVDAKGSLQALEPQVWQDRQDQLRRAGGPPKAASRWLFDPILYGPDPTARARGWMERKCWPEAEAAFADVIRARPMRSSVWIERGRFYIMRSEPEKAASDFVQALLLGDFDFKLIDDMVASDEMLDRVLVRLPRDATDLRIGLMCRRVDVLVREGRLEHARGILDRVANLPWEEVKPSRLNFHHPGGMFATLGRPDQVAGLLRKFQHTTDPDKANEVVWYCVLAPRAVADLDASVKLAELAVRGFPAERKHLALNTLGAALFHAGQFEDAIRHLEAAIKARNGAQEPFDWPFLAMAHHRLGHHDEARRWLERLQSYRPSDDPRRPWDELEIRLLRSEAEALILYDPVFPANPFAH